jgi:hypothetical protein
MASLGLVEPDDLFCSFCGKSKAAVRKLIAGGNNRSQPDGRYPARDLPLVCICNECVALIVANIDMESK